MGTPTKEQIDEYCRTHGFPRSDYPYYETVDLCGSSEFAEIVPDGWPPISFESACTSHDRCYMTYGKTQQECDDRFYEDLIEAVKRDLSQPTEDVPPPPSPPFLPPPPRMKRIVGGYRGTYQPSAKDVGVYHLSAVAGLAPPIPLPVGFLLPSAADAIEPGSLSRALVVAKVYFEAVQAIGKEAFGNAQGKAKQYKDLVDAYIQNYGVQAPDEYEALDQVNDPAWRGGAVNVAPANKVSQTFVPSLSCLTTVEIALVTGNSGRGGDQVTLKILGTGGSELASVTANIPEGFDGFWRFDLSGGGINVTPGQPVTMLVQDTGKVVFWWKYVNGNPYAAGQAYFNSTPFGDNDFLFKIYGKTVQQNTPQVTLYEHINFRGRSQAFGPGIYRADHGELSIIGNDTVSSLKVPNGVWVRLQEHEDGGMMCDFGPGEYFYVGDDFNDKTSYVEVVQQ